VTAAMHRILVVEDDPAIRSVLRTLLLAEKHRVSEAETAERAIVEARAGKPDLIIVDLGLPDADGHSVIRQVRQFSPVPIIVLSARTLDAEKIAALDEGADDYVTKPFGAAEFLARVRAALRRAVRGDEPGATFKVGRLSVDLARRETTGDDGPVHLTPLEYRLLESLARRIGLVVTHATLIQQVWGPNSVDDTRSLRAYVKALRQKIEPDPARPRYLVTEIGIGYRLKRDEPTGATD
jgi:two-component system, OmpR family, KDP operon response regulator KdpE